MKAETAAMQIQHFVKVIEDDSVKRIWKLNPAA